MISSQSAPADSLTSDRALRATLHQIGLHSPAPLRLEDFYAKALGYHFQGDSGMRLGIAQDRRITIQEGAAKSLAYAAYAVADPGQIDALERRLKESGTSFDRIEMQGFQPGVIAFADPDGNCLRFSVILETAETNLDAVAARAARIQHVVFASTDVERLLTFLTDVVGFTLSDRVEADDGTLRTAFVRCSHEHHSLAVFAAPENRLDHHCYEAVDWALIRDWADHFAKLRIPLKWGPGRHGPGNNLFLFVHDPDGNWLEISAELEQVSWDRPVGIWPHEEYTLNTWGIGLLRS